MVGLIAACTDALTPRPADELLAPAQLELALANGQKWHFEAVLTFIGTVEPGDVRVTPSGIIFGTDLINAFEMTGDLEGVWYFIGKFRANPRDGRGRSIAMPVLLELTSPGIGTFECSATGKIEGFPLEIIQYGNQTGCHGTGDFEGMKMRARFTNEANPGIATYELIGEMW